MTIRLRTAFFAFLGILTFWFLYSQIEILTPFILAAILAYIINPLVDFLSRKVKLNRTFSVILVYFILLGIFVIGSVILTKRIVEESSELQSFVTRLVSTTNQQVQTLPDWIQPTVSDALTSVEKTGIVSASPSLLAIFPKAISGLVSFVIFLFSMFVFLKEGGSLMDKFLHLVPNDYKIEVEILIRKLNSAFGGYLRGQLFLVFFVSSVLFISLSILGVKFSLVLAIFSGLAEIVPFIGPIVAGAIASFVALNSQNSNFGLNPYQLLFAVIIVYFVLRQLEDYFVTPYVMGKITKLHPLIILFAVIAGGHTFGIMGLILAVPVAAFFRILLEFSLDKINSRGRRT